MDTFLTITEASQFAHVDEQVLKQLVQRGKIRTVMLSDGAVLVSKRDIEPQIPLEERDEYQEFAHLAGESISLSEASRRYGVPYQTISRWVTRGMIDRRGYEGRATLVDHAQVATCAKIYNSEGGGQGKWIFKGGLPYYKKIK